MKCEFLADKCFIVGRDKGSTIVQMNEERLKWYEDRLFMRETMNIFVG